jgi:Asp-tRNA(Asn)/Glu-tRNA(Gln) amidotransferase A subunit family amidase
VSAFPEYEQYDAVGLAELVRSKHISAQELLDAAIERVDARNPIVNAVISRRIDDARDAIRAGLPDGPFTGVPFLLKDLNGWRAGDRVTRGSRFFGDVPPAAADSVHVERLKAAGLVIFGRTNTCEAGMSLTCEPRFYGPTRSPWNPDRISGGSSGGAAAAVGARMVPMAHASDGFGSIRAPAACCGLVGLKPTRGRNSFAPYSGEGLAGCSTEHAVTLSIRDSATLLDATRGIGPGDPYTAPVPLRSFASEVGANPGRRRIAFTRRAPNGAPVAAEYIATLEETAKLCESLGHHVEEVDPAIDAEQVVPAFLTIIAANTVVSLASHPMKQRLPGPDEVERITHLMMEMGRRVSAAEYVRATQTMHRLGRQMAAFHEEWDVLLTPALGTLPPPIGWIDMMMEDVDEYWRRVFAFSPFTVLANLTGQPALTLPIGQMADGFPSAVQLVAPFGDEKALIRLGSQLESTRPWFDRRPRFQATNTQST